MQNMQKRPVPRALTLVLLVLLALASANPVAADPPTREPLTLLDDTIPADVCGFEIKVEFTFNTLHLTTFPAQDGQPLIQTVTGALRATLTNLSTAKSLDYNVSGPAKYTVLDDGSFSLMGSGPWLLPDPTWPSSPPGYPALFYLTGHFVAQVDAAGNLVSFTSTGDIDDICAALSD